jgi:aspartyl-tRNA(Asn)/glutamyl-tRNA(Gln) amidotransferase subunit A
MTDLLDLDLVALTHALRARRVAAIEVVDAYLMRIATTEPRLHAFTTVFADDARRRARRLDESRTYGPLHGVPMAVKDIIDERGRVTSAGVSLRRRPAAADAPVVATLRRAGAILVGRTNLDPFAVGATTSNRRFGQTRNPFDTQRIAGGSSGGSAAAVAARSVVAALGTDSGGSVRVPAALCGVVGVQPTLGRLSNAGIDVVSWTTHSVGPITRTVRDAALLLNVMMPVRMPPADIREMRIGLPTPYFDEGLGGEVLDGMRAARRALRACGVKLIKISIPHIDLSPSITVMIARAESAASHGAEALRRRSEVGAFVAARLTAGMSIRAVDYLFAQQARSLLRAEVDRALKDCDALLVPTAATAAIPVGAMGTWVNDRWLSLRDLFARLTVPFSLTGHPVVALPVGRSSAGLPVGAQIVANHDQEGTALRIAMRLEKELGLDLRPGF